MGWTRVSLPGKDLRRQFGMVLQDAWLFEGSIATNIAYGKPDATREEVEAAVARVDFLREDAAERLRHLGSITMQRT